tara:strand:+ start:5177 stop:6571 length:1395 start_codon:yes stop_codon:yes gene_type:complete
MIKNIKISLAILLSTLAISCSDFLDVNENPNQSIDVPSELILKGMELATVQIQLGHSMRISQLWTGQLKGQANLYRNLYNYNISPEESNSEWSFGYHGVITQNRIIQDTSEDMLIKGIGNVLEASAVGSMAAMFGDIPYSQFGQEDPEFDSQTQVFEQVQSLLDNAITQLSAASPSRISNQDILVGKKPAAWIEVANTLKARFYLITKNYTAALSSANKGISSDANNMSFGKGFGSFGSTLENSNLYYIVLDGSRGGDFSTTGSYIDDLLNPTKTNSRNHAKTNETRRKDFLSVDINSRTVNTISYKSYTLPMVSFQENSLIIIETTARLNEFDQGLSKLNTYRAYLNSGKGFIGNPSLLSKYEAFVSADFEANGIENLDGLSKDKALLREIMEEKYVSCFGTHITFDDFRRWSVSDPDLVMKIPPVTGSQHPQRLPISQNEIDGNSNTPSPIPSIFEKTLVNK